VERIDHGVRCLEDPALVTRLVRDRVPLTVCPLSNVRLGVVPDLAAHPLPAMLEVGLLVTVNSDDPAYFGGYLGDNVTALRTAFGWDDTVLRRLAENSFRASFLPPERIAALVAEVRGA
jgi:adenosine deaminase